MKLKFETSAYASFEKICSNSSYVGSLVNVCIVELEEMGNPDFRFESTSKSNQKYVTIKLPKISIKSPKITKISDQLKFSLNQRTGLVSSIAKEGGENIDDLSVISETLNTQRVADDPANDLILSESLSMYEKYYPGVLPE
ncbi:hypothetical protein AVEN_172167-1 [Araneus ventricosus]|uniref:Uncharacterized protein n=1 Tax=Araneus ventricosus TaxID=182803 RepID=A0A4Y2JKR7_ARAVE|nr:hypothetical protein AVEN_172167-1 [Araneus ventricosus]